ncbi:MAG: hypothetical protein H0T62_08850 [Parachlamydiaceae bacterium]|nr:hypothetical protein [Parachlamydiaceae bacterium]
MEIIVDNQIVKFLANNPTDTTKIPLISDPKNQILFRWPSLLEYLELGSIFANLPAFDETQPIFKTCISMLSVNEDKEILFYVFDRLFTENLNQIKNLPQINAPFLSEAINAHRQTSNYLAVEHVLSEVLDTCKAVLEVNAVHTMHDLILYLAWDRMCMCMARIFDYQSTDPIFTQGIEVLRGCLIESYQHINQQGMTIPGIYRMLEALFFYEMREENLQNHTATNWITLNQSYKTFVGQNELPDFFYIDDAIIPVEELKSVNETSECYLTQERSENVQARLALTQLMLSKLKAENSQWNYVLQPQKIVCLS